MLTILEAATSANLTKDKARYWLKLLNIEPIKKDRVLLFPDDAAYMLASMQNAVSTGMPPVAAAAEIKTTYAPPAITPEQPEYNTAVIERLHGVESAIMLLVENNQRLIAQNRELAGIVSKQSRQIDSLSAKLFPPPVAPTKKTEVNIPLWRRLWLELWSPEKLRATP